MARLTASVRQRILDQNEGLVQESIFFARETPQKKEYMVPSGKLLIRAKGTIGKPLGPIVGMIRNGLQVRGTEQSL